MVNINNDNKKIVTLGEIMLRLSTPGFERFTQASSFNSTYGGGEANVAVSLAQFGHKSSFISKLPTNEIGQAAINHLNRYGVNTRNIIRGGNRIGIYYLEGGASMRPSKVIYDRAYSSISEAKVDEFNFDEIFKNAKWFHFSGITPALSENSQKLTKEALISAKKMGLTISVDLNFRKKLWSSEKAIKMMTPLMQYVDVCIGNEEDAENVLGFAPSNSDVNSGKLNIEGYKTILAQMYDKFNFKYVVSTLRKSYSASDNGWSSLIYDGTEYYKSKEYDIRLVDRVGGGDAFSAGLIHGLLDSNKNFKQALEFATAASALKQTIPGDFNILTESEVDSLVNGDSSGRVRR